MNIQCSGPSGKLKFTKQNLKRTPSCNLRVQCGEMVSNSDIKKFSHPIFSLRTTLTIKWRASSSRRLLYMYGAIRQQLLNTPLRRTAKRLFSMSISSSEVFSIEKRVAVAAVRRACLVTCTVFDQLVRDRTDTLSKDDESPVTGITICLSTLTSSN